MVEICVIALMGLPASGKTTFSKTVLTNPSIQYNCIHICYDEIFTFMPQNSKMSFKEERKRVLETIEERIISLKLVENTQEKPFVILCDDNNYYAGMRHEIYKICNKNQVSFGQIYFVINLKDALLRNSIRDTGTLPIGIIEQMNTRLEVPSTKNQWEKHTLTVSSSFNFEDFNGFIKSCLKHPMKHLPKPYQSPINTKANFTHDLDILLRKRIKELLQETDGDLRIKANVLNERRKKILVDIKGKDMSEANLNVDHFLKRLISDL